MSIYKKAFVGISQKVEELNKELGLRSVIFDNPLKMVVKVDCPFEYRDLKYVEYLANGHQYAVIAEMEGLSVRTIEAQVEKLQKKAGVTTLPSLVALFMRNGWIN